MSAGVIWLVSILATIAFVLLWVELADRRQRRREREDGRLPIEEALGPKGNVDVLRRREP